MPDERGVCQGRGCKGANSRENGARSGGLEWGRKMIKIAQIGAELDGLGSEIDMDGHFLALRIKLSMGNFWVKVIAFNNVIGPGIQEGAVSGLKVPWVLAMLCP